MNICKEIDKWLDITERQRNTLKAVSTKVNAKNAVASATIRNATLTKATVL